jgi:hypothetical protein
MGMDCNSDPRGPSDNGGSSGRGEQQVISLRTVIAGSASLANMNDPPEKILSVTYSVIGPGKFSQVVNGGTGEVITLNAPTSGWQGTWEVTCNLNYLSTSGSSGSIQGTCVKSWDIGQSLKVWFELEGVANQVTGGVDLKLSCD